MRMPPRPSCESKDRIEQPAHHPPPAMSIKRTNNTTTARSGGFSNFQVIMLVVGILLLERMVLYPPDLRLPETREDAAADDDSSSQTAQAQDTAAASGYASYNSPLGIPEGKAPNLPSVRIEEKGEVDRSIYGGKGDKKHLGGFTDIDVSGLSPAVWKYMVQNWTIQSVIDVGCGRGISTSWFVVHGLRTECVEGSHDAIQQSMVPDDSILTEHDFSRGPWWPSQTFDVAWSVEFLEHVNLQFHHNYVATFRKAAIIMATSSRWGGWHHVEVHQDDWWIRKYESYGFRYDPALTDQIRAVARGEQFKFRKEFPPTGQKEKNMAQHIGMSMKVFVNPVVAALPEHAHLFGEVGCFQDYSKPNRECGRAMAPNQRKTADVETPLDPAFYPLQITAEQDNEWYTIVKNNIIQKKEQSR